MFSVKLVGRGTPIERDSGRFSALLDLLLAPLAVSPVAGIMLRSTPRASAILFLALAWPLLTLVAFLSGVAGARQGIEYAVIGIAAVFSVLALATWRKG
jgi:hypothetical protein